jgi:hypothetical protein
VQSIWRNQDKQTLIYMYIYTWIQDVLRIKFYIFKEFNLVRLLWYIYIHIIQNTGGFYKCNRFDAIKTDGSSTSAQKAKAELDRWVYIFIYMFIYACIYVFYVYLYIFVYIYTCMEFYLSSKGKGMNTW